MSTSTPRPRRRPTWPAGSPPPGGRTVAATLLLALDAADARQPAGLARPVIRLAAVLDPAGHPAAVWATDAATGYLTQNRTRPPGPAGTQPPVEASPEVTSAQAREVLMLLHRYGLASFDDQAGPRAVRVHALTGRAARETTPPALAPAIAQAAAGALLAIWPEPDHTAPALAEALRASTTALAGHARDTLWHPGGHPALFRTGISLLNAGLHTAAIAHWQRTTADAERILGPEHPATLTAQANLASSYYQAGRTADAITIMERVAADRARILGPEHPDTVTAADALREWKRRHRRRPRLGRRVPE